MIFTALPVMALAVLDQALPRSVLEDNVVAYRAAKGGAFGAKVFASWILRSVTHAGIVFMFTYPGLVNVTTESGHSAGMWHGSTSTYIAVVLVPTFLALLVIKSVTVIHMLSILISVVSLFFFLYVLNIAYVDMELDLNPDLYGVVNQIFASPLAWLTLLLAVMIPLLLEAAWLGLKQELCPDMVTVMQERLAKRTLQQREKARRREAEGVEMTLQVCVCVCIILTVELQVFDGELPLHRGVLSTVARQRRGCCWSCVLLKN